MVIERIIVKIALMAAHIIFVKLVPFIFATQLQLFLLNDQEALHRCCIAVYCLQKLARTGFMESEKSR